MRFSSAVSLFSIGHVLAFPAPQVSDPTTPQVPVDQPGPPGSSGSLRGSGALAGYSPDENVPTSPSTVVPPEDFELAPGQSEDAEIGLYIDLSSVKNPQAIRGGTTSPTDPGPRYIHIPSNEVG